MRTIDMAVRVGLLLVIVALSMANSDAALRTDYAAAGGGITPLPPLVNSPPNAPQLHKSAPLPTLIASSASSRFLLLLRRANGDIVDHARAEVRGVSVLDAPLGEALFLDVLPLDGAGAPVVGIPVVAGAGVSVIVGHEAR